MIFICTPYIIPKQRKAEPIKVKSSKVHNQKVIEPCAERKVENGEMIKKESGRQVEYQTKETHDVSTSL